MINHFIFVYLISENEKENDFNSKQIKSSVINAVVESYNNSWIAFNALRSDSNSGKQPDIILIDHHILSKHGFHFLEEYHHSDFLDKEKTHLLVMSDPKNIDALKLRHQLVPQLRVLPKPLTEEMIDQLTEL